MAGLAADAFMFAEKGHGDSEDGASDTDHPEVQEPPRDLSLLEGDDAGMPTSDDTPDPADPDEVLSGGSGADVIDSHGGDDSVTGREGDDLLGGRDGDDTLSGGDGRDALDGGAGDDWLIGDAGDDQLVAGAGDDLLLGGTGDDRLAGCEGDDSLNGGSGNDSLTGGEGADTVNGDTGDDEVAGGLGDDLLTGGAGRDVLEGGAGNDSLDGGPDAETDFLNGGLGDDLLSLGAGDVGNGGEGADSFALRDIGTGDAPPQIADFNPQEDALLVLYDATLHPDPMLSLTVDEGSGTVTLLLDGVPLAALTNGALPDLSQVQLRAA